MNKEEIIRKTQGKKTYQAPYLSVYGRVSQLTSSGSGIALEGTDANEVDEKRFVVIKVKDWRP